MSQHKLYPDTAKMLSALMKRIFPEGVITLSFEEIAAAPEIEMKELFGTGQVELRLVKDKNE